MIALHLTFSICVGVYVPLNPQSAHSYYIWTFDLIIIDPSSRSYDFSSPFMQIHTHIYEYILKVSWPVCLRIFDSDGVEGGGGGWKKNKELVPFPLIYCIIYGKVVK